MKGAIQDALGDKLWRRLPFNNLSLRLRPFNCYPHLEIIVFCV